MDYFGFTYEPWWRGNCRTAEEEEEQMEEEGRKEEKEGECSSARGGLYSWQSASRWIRTAMDGMDERNDRGGEARDGMDGAGGKIKRETASGGLTG